MRAVTYEQILAGTLAKLPTKADDKRAAWQGHIAVVLELKDNLKLNRMQIAEVAERACMIYQGGDKQSEEYRKNTYRLTLKHFCREVGLVYTTLNTWILVKNRVFSALPEQHKGSSFNLTVAKECGEYFKGKGYFDTSGKAPSAAEIREVYERRVKPSERKMRQVRVFKYLRAVHYYLFTKNNWSLFSDDERLEMRNFLREILASLNKHEEILKRKKK